MAGYVGRRDRHLHLPCDGAARRWADRGEQGSDRNRGESTLTSEDEPSGPLEFALQLGPGDSIVLTWSPPRQETRDGLFTGPEVDVDGYLINVTTLLASGEQSTRQLADLGSTARTWTHAGAVAGIWSLYSIRGHKNGDEGRAAHTDWVRILRTDEPDSPSNLRLSQQADPTEVRLDGRLGRDRLQDLPPEHPALE